MMPSLRLDQSELKCKNGCDYFGNPQWQGYCSKCHREQMQRQRRAEKTSTSTLPKPEQKKSERNLKLTSHSSFSKFEEKRHRQSETLKKANLLKFNVFKKSTQEDHHHEQSTLERRQPEFKIPSNILEGMKREFRVRFPTLSVHVDRDAKKFVHALILDVMKCSNSAMSVDELSERVQRQYQHFMKHMDTSPHFSAIESETKELLMDFVEKHAMTYLHELPSVVFSPTGTDDERLDRTMSDRIQQLSWVTEKHLECKLDKDDHNCRQLLYKAISELLGMDAALSPGGKLSRVRRCCRHVLQLCAPPASADDLLPALIFTVLKANPPRLLSNINFVSRFSNAQRLMTGEAGYYFTNLCCAVSFIEKLTADSLNMDKKEFDCYMAMPASIGGSSWAAALSLCAELREADEERALTQKLLEQARDIYRRADELAHNATTFEETIAKKVQDVLSKTPLEIKARRELPRFGKFKNIKTASLIDLELMSVPKEESKPQEQIITEIPEVLPNTTDKTVVEVKLQEEEQVNDIVDSSSNVQEAKLNILGFEVVEKPTPPKTPPNFEQAWDLKQTSSLELLTPSPLGFTPFDSRSVDELMTPDEFASDNLAPGLGNINYDIDLSDFSGDNSMADDAPKNETKDPFSPEGLKKGQTFDPFAPPRDPFSPILEPTSSETVPPVPYTSIMPQLNEPFSPLELHNPEASKRDPFSPIKKENTSILDDNNSPTTACLLPSPLQPQTSSKEP